MKLRIDNGRVIDPANNIDGRFDVLVEGGKITAVAEDLRGAANVLNEEIAKFRLED